MSSELTYTIGKVVARLQQDFPDLTVSKVRFLETEGLITPKRTNSGYRLYSEADVQRLQQILQFQKNYFYPLSVIKEKLDDPSCIAIEVNQPASPTHEPVVKIPDSLSSIENMAETTSVPPTFIRELIEGGFLNTSKGQRGETMVSGRDAVLIKSAFELLSYGFDIRYLKSHIQRVNRDVPLYKQALAISSKKNQTTPEGDSEVLDHLMHLNNCVFNTLLRRTLGM